MFLRRILLFLLSFCAGTAVSAGSFAFLIVIGVIPRLLRRTQMNNRVLLVENVIIPGIIFGCIMSLWERDPSGMGTLSALLSTDTPQLQEAATLPAQTIEMAKPLSTLTASASFFLSVIGHFLIALYGISAGIFVGGIAVSLAEILHTFPIIFRRFHLTEGLSWMMCAMAIGKLCGALFSFYGGYWY